MARMRVSQGWTYHPPRDRVPETYHITTDGTTVYVRDTSGQLVGSPSADVGAQLTTALPAASSAGAEINLGDGSFPQSSVPALPKGITGKLRIRGSAATVITGSSGGPRFADLKPTSSAGTGSGFSDDATINVASTTGFASSGTLSMFGTAAAPIAYTGKTATSFTGCTCSTHTAYSSATTFTQAYETFKNIELSDLIFDANSVAAATNTHVLLGNLVGGAWYHRTNFADITIRRCKTVNVALGTGSSTTQNISFVSRHEASAEATQTSVKDILVEDCNFQGGDDGVVLMGSSSASGGVCNVFLDRICAWRTRHDTLTLPTANKAQVNFQFGGGGFGGHYELVDCYGANSGDVNLEVDSPTSCMIARCTMQDAWNEHYLIRNFATPQDPEAQIATLRDCDARLVNLSPNSGSYRGCGFYLHSNAAPNPTFGHIILDGCTYLNKRAEFGLRGLAIVAGDNTTGAPISRLTIRDFQAIHDSINDTSGTTPVGTIYVRSSTNCVLSVKGLHVRLLGTMTTGVAVRTVNLNGSDCFLDVDVYSYDCNLAGMTNGNTRALAIGEAAASAMHGTIKNFTVKAFAGADANPKGIEIFGTATLTIASRIRIINPDFRKFAGTPAPFSFGAGAQAKVDLSGVNWDSATGHPRPSAAMGTTNFAAATFTSTVANQYIGGEQADIHFANGSGAAITKIEASKDGTTYEEVWNQASGAMAQDVLVPVDNGDYIKVTFATTQPTTRVRYRRT